MAISLDATALDYTNVSQFQEWKVFHDNLQGNILKGHGRDHTVHLFLRFPNAPSGNTFIGQILPLVTSASTQILQTLSYQGGAKNTGIFGNFFLTHAGYVVLGVPGGQIPNDASFMSGMAARSSTLNDPDKTTWDEGFRDDIHAMLLLADDDEGYLNLKVREVYAQGFANGVMVVREERGRVIRNNDNNGIEHFGYVDGRSQPLYYLQDIQSESQNGDGLVLIGPQVLGQPTYKIDSGGEFNPTAPLRLVLVQEPGQTNPGDNYYGSYFVFRKLEQDVRGFKKMEADLAEAMKLKGDDAELAGGMVVGRFEDGTPVTLMNREGLTDPVLNNFNFKGDPEGSKCPFHAHIRKVNPRTTDVDERKHRITRRGIPYGERAVEPKDNPTIEQMPTGGVGLLFMCFQSDIANQFEFMQSSWANDGVLQNNTRGLDPVIGQIGQGDSKTPQLWPVVWGHPFNVKFSFDGFVKMKGGEYFFAPSLGFLDGIAGSTGNSSGATVPAPAANVTPQED